VTGLIYSLAHAAAPNYSAASLSLFEEWRAAHVAASPTSGDRTPTASLLRRIVQLHRAGDSFAEIARCCSLAPRVARDAWDRLPEHLR
jgi:hypothetical protein